MDPWVVDALREEFLDNGAAELGVDVDALEIVLKPYGIQVDIHVCYFSITVCVSNLIETYADEKADERRENEIDCTSRENGNKCFVAFRRIQNAIVFRIAMAYDRRTRGLEKTSDSPYVGIQLS